MCVRRYSRLGGVPSCFCTAPAAATPVRCSLLLLHLRQPHVVHVRLPKFAAAATLAPPSAKQAHTKPAPHDAAEPGRCSHGAQRHIRCRHHTEALCSSRSQATTCSPSHRHWQQRRSSPLRARFTPPPPAPPAAAGPCCRAARQCLGGGELKRLTIRGVQLPLAGLLKPTGRREFGTAPLAYRLVRGRRGPPRTGSGAAADR
jgi:hypothetical protein